VLLRASEVEVSVALTKCAVVRYGNATTADLWAAWAKAAASTGDIEDFPGVMSKWTEQMGFPLLTLKSAPTLDGEGNVMLSLSQKWFLADGSEATEADGPVKL